MTNFFEKTTLDSLLPRSNFDEDLLGNKNSNDMDSLSNGASGLLTSFDTTPDFTSSHQSSFLSRILPTNAPVNTQPQNQNNASTTSDEESIEAMLDFNDTDSQSNSLVATDTKTENNPNDTTNITNNNNTSTKTETPPPPEKRMTEAALEALLKNPKSIDLEQFQSTPSFKAVCSALTKTQGPILKFSEIFGPLAEPFVPSKKRKVNFAKPQNESRDSPIGEEELWAEYDSADDNEMSDDNNDMQIQDEDAVGQALTTDPTKKPPESLERVLPVSTSEAFSLAAQQHWEASIVWTDNNFDSDIDMGSLQQELFAKPPPSVTAPPPKPRTSTVHWGEINTAPVVAEAPAQETKPAAVAFKPMVSSVPPPLTSGPLGVPSSPAPLFRSASQPDLKKLTSMPSLMRMPSSASIAKMPMKPNPRLKTPLNDELEEGTWADTIVWDDKKPPAKPPLTQLIIDFNDTDVFPENPEKSQIFQTVGSQSQDVSKTKKRKLEETEAEELDRFNISNDTFYKTLNRANKMPEKFGKSKILHSEPAWRLSLVKTHLVDKDLEDFHHPKMTIPLDEPQKIHLVPNDQVYESTQSQNRSEAMRKKSDMSGKDGRIVLMEYVEERPPILMNVGMGTKAKNFYRKRNANENPLLRFDDGENVLMDVAEKSPFVLGDVNPGQTVQALDNNMFIAPVFRHVVPETDFLVVRQGKKLYLREIPAIYTVGQLQPRMEVYQPNSRPANDFVKKRLQAYIHRMFMKNSTLQVKISDIMTLFPGNSETAIRKRLKDCADFQRGGGDTGSWVVTDQSKLPNEDDLRRNVPPEHVCLYESMLAGMYYLREAGVTRFTTTSPQFTAALQQIDSEGNEILKRAAHRLEEELLLSPWNLTFNFRMYTEKKGLLQLSGLGDPSGRGEGFSYLRMPMKNNQQSKKKKELQKTQVTGTDADLRKLSLDNARKVLLHFGVSESEIARLGRWERIALVRKKSSEVAASGEGGLTKFARGSRYSMHQQQLQYKEQEQMIWENQSRALSDPTPDLSDEEDEEEMEDFEKDLETMLDTASKKRKRNEQKEKYEEAEKEEYEKFAQELKGNAASSHAPQPGTYVPTSLDAISNAKKYLKRKVVVKNPDGTKSEKIEWITDPEQVEAILQAEREKIKNRRLPRAIPSQMTPEEAEERKKLHREKRRLQEQLRRLRQNQQKQEALVESIYAGSVSPDDRRIPALVKCTKCGQHGHNRTNHSCPLYNERDTKESKKDRLQPLSKDNSLSGSKEGLIVRIKKNEVTSRPSKEDLEVNYLVQQSGKNAKRRRRDPQVEFSNVLERLVERIKTMPQAVPFLKPVAKNDKWAPDYHKIIRNPIDLSTIKQRLGKLVHYKSRGDFLKDMRLMKENCYIYNQHRNPHLLPMVDQVYAECESFFHENDEEIAQLEREIAEGVDEVMSPQTPRSYSNPTSPQMSPQNDWLHGHRPTTPSQMSPPMSPGVAMSPPPGQMSPTADSRAMSPSQFFNADPEDGEIDVV